MHHIEIGRAPVFIEGVNIPFARFLSNIRITPDTLEPHSGIHHHQLVMSNPWSYAITGRVFIVEPGGYTQGSGNIDRSWEIAPRVIPFSLEAGGVFRAPLEWSFSAGELVGPKPLVFDVELSADEQYPIVRVTREINLDFDGLDISSTARWLGNGVAEITVSVINRTNTTMNLEAVAVPVRESRTRASINGLEPGGSMSRKFIFRNTRHADEIVIGISIVDQDIRINSVVKVP
ncbi:MAG: hypothetical protein JKY96_08250 [Phycisphaerales bacterium]|nr:hypothetical protein [Phycisphaerales bacterium]